MRSVLVSVGSQSRSTTSTALLNASALGLRGYVDTPSHIVAMHLLDLCVYVLCTSRTQRVVGYNSHTAYHQCLTLIRRYCWMKRPRPTLHDRVHETGSTDVLRTQVASGCLFLQL